MSWNIFKAVARGTSHVERDMPCQDAAEVWQSAEWLVAAVADGAGSASRSELGSELCVKAVVSALRDYLEATPTPIDWSDEAVRDRLMSLLEGVRDEICALAASHGLEPRDLACTLVGAVARSHGDGLLFHVGDGAGVVQFKHADLPPVVSQPENGEYSNETWFLTDLRWRDKVRMTTFSGEVDMLALMSDGAMSFAMSKDRSRLFPQFIDPVARFLRERSAEEGNPALQSLLESERTHDITNDDKSLVLAFAQI